MKILAIGDFHGKFQKKWESLIKKEKIDLIVSNGDFFPFIYRKLWFKHCYGTDIELWEVVGKKKYKELVKKDLIGGESAIRKLDRAEVPVFTVVGNLDYTTLREEHDGFPHKDDLRRKDLLIPILKKYKNIRRFEYKSIRFGDFIFIGGYGGSFPGEVKSKAYKRYRKKLDGLFKRFRKENRNRRVIFVSHNVPYNTKLDKITSKEAPESVKGKHYGSKLVRRIINTYQPVLHIGGHIHESWGKQKIGKTLAVNPGAAHEGRAAVVEIVGKRVKVRFIK